MNEPVMSHAGSVVVYVYHLFISIYTINASLGPITHSYAIRHIRDMTRR